MDKKIYAIEVENLVKKIKVWILWKEKVLLNWISLKIKKNSVFWFLWPNWAWKTTTIKNILWIAKPTQWVISINVEWVKEDNWKHKIWFMPENTWLYKYMTWIEFLKANWLFYNKSMKWFEERTNFILKKVWLEFAKNNKLSTYSKWMLQRVNLAQAILHNPDILFFDEPMSGLDPIWRAMVKGIIKELKDEWKTIFLNSHILSDIEDLCDEIWIINNWVIIEQGYLKDILKDWESLEEHFVKKILEVNDKAFEKSQG